MSDPKQAWESFEARTTALPSDVRAMQERLERRVKGPNVTSPIEEARHLHAYLQDFKAQKIGYDQAEIAKGCVSLAALISHAESQDKKREWLAKENKGLRLALIEKNPEWDAPIRAAATDMYDEVVAPLKAEVEELKGIVALAEGASPDEIAWSETQQRRAEAAEAERDAAHLTIEKFTKGNREMNTIIRGLREELAESQATEERQAVAKIKLQDQLDENHSDKTLTIQIDGGSLRVDAEWVEKLDQEVKRIGRWMHENPDCRQAYERWVG